MVTPKYLGIVIKGGQFHFVTVRLTKTEFLQSRVFLANMMAKFAVHLTQS